VSTRPVPTAAWSSAMLSIPDLRIPAPPAPWLSVMSDSYRG
jgi:hypothetical protein